MRTVSDKNKYNCLDLMNSLSASCLLHSPCSSARPLHLAARNGLATVVQALLSRGATVLAVDEEGESF